MSIFLAFVILFFASAAQSGIIPQIRILGGQPDITFIIVLVWSVQAKLEEAVPWALIGGILQDLLSSTPLGISSLGMILMIFVVDQLKTQFSQIPFLIVLGLVVVGTILQHMITIVFLQLDGTEIDLVPAISFVLLPTVLYNLVVSFPIYIFVRFIHNRTMIQRTTTR